MAACLRGLAGIRRCARSGLLAGLLQGAHAGGVPAWDFTLATLDGDRFVQASGLPGPVLVNFWGDECPPCVAELPRLQAFARRQPGWTLLLVATDAPQEARAYLKERGITLVGLKGGPDVAVLMRSAGNRSGGLPFTVVLRDGHICQSHEGELSEAALERVGVACGDAAPAARP